LAFVELWRADHDGYEWVISYEPGFESWSEDEKRKFIGYHASYRRKDSQIVDIDGSPFPSFEAASDACSN
jgi:hypothetical protein